MSKLQFLNRSYATILLILAGLVCALSSCITLNYLDNAQDSFSKGAELENLSTFTTETFTNVSPNSYYILAYSQVKEALKNTDQLRQDTLLGNAYSIKALCEWKLKRYLQARVSANQALAEFKRYEAAGIFMHRDKAVMRALGGLIEIDQVNDTLYQHFGGDNIDPMAAKEFFLRFVHDAKEENTSNIESALTTIEMAKKDVRPTHGVQVYFLLCQLSALKVWSDGFDFLKNSVDTAEGISAEDRRKLRDFIFAERDAYKVKKDRYMQMLAKKLPKGEGDEIFQFWNDKL